MGKTASVVNIGAGLAKLNKQVLLIDLDPQESLTYWLGIESPPKTVYDFFNGTASFNACKVRHVSGFDVIPSNEMLATITPEVDALKRGIREQSYDYVLLDCSPTLGITTLAALTAADWVIIPLYADLLSLKGMSQLLGTIQTIQEQTNPDLLLKGIVATRYSNRKKMHKDVLEQIKTFFSDIDIFTVRDNVAVAESPVKGQSVLDYKPKSPGAIDYLSIARKIAHV